MKKLFNTKEYKTYLQSLLNSGKPIHAEFSLGVFQSELADSLTSKLFKGIVTELDYESGYCNWNHETGHSMPRVKINCITLI